MASRAQGETPGFFFVFFLLSFFKDIACALPLLVVTTRLRPASASCRRPDTHCPPQTGRAQAISLKNANKNKSQSTEVVESTANGSSTVLANEK